jgi:hypothetical protein
MSVRSGGGAGLLIRVLVRFDLSSIPAGSTVNSASLQLCYYSYLGSDPVNRLYVVYRVTTNWVEGDGTGIGTTGANWNKPDKSALPTWTTPGGDFTTSGASPPTPVPAWISIVGQYVTWDVTAIVKAWIESGQSNYGFLVRDPNDGVVSTDAAATFLSKESGIPPNEDWPLKPPILTVDYTLSAPVGGIVVPVDKLGVFAPYLALFGVIAAATVVSVASRKKIEN